MNKRIKKIRVGVEKQLVKGARTPPSYKQIMKSLRHVSAGRHFGREEMNER